MRQRLYTGLFDGWGDKVGKEALIRVCDVSKEVRWLQRRIDGLREEIKRLEAGGTVRDMVKGGSGNDQIYHIEGMPLRDLERKKALLGQRIVKLSGKQVELEEAMTAAEAYILSIDDHRVRQILEHIYIDGMTQGQVGDLMHLDQSVVSRTLTAWLKATPEQIDA